MSKVYPLLADHLELTRRYFMRLGAAGLAGTALAPLAAGAEPSTELAELIKELEYLTNPEDFRTVERGNPLPYTLPPEKLRAAGMTRETWRLEVVADELVDPKPQLGRTLSKKEGTALTFEGLMKLAEKKAVSFLKVMTCNNIGSPLGVGLWEGVPLRDVIWLTKPEANVRRVFYHGYHNDDPKQLFQSSLSIGRVLEDPPGMPPITLCYKLNGRPLSGKRGGPVRLLAPEAYGFKSVKWLNRVVLSNLFHANDTYARGNNDVDSWMKTFAQFVFSPRKTPAGKPIPVTGLAQVGISGLKRVQVWLTPSDTKLDKNDPYFTKAPWVDADILPPPDRWQGGLPDNKLGRTPLGFDAKTGKPKSWPMPYTLAHWAILLPKMPAGRYHLRCRTIDVNGFAQPMPRPFRKSGRTAIQDTRLVVEG